MTGVQTCALPISYLWNNSGAADTIKNLTGGTYNVTVNDAAGCSATAGAVVNSSGAGNVTITGIQTQICATDSADICAPSGYNSYLWNTGAGTQTINPTSSGAYTVTVTNANGCTGSASQSVTINPNPAPSITGTFNVCQGNTATLTASAGFKIGRAHV